MGFWSRLRSRIRGNLRRVIGVGIGYVTSTNYPPGGHAGTHYYVWVEKRFSDGTHESAPPCGSKMSEVSGDTFAAVGRIARELGIPMSGSHNSGTVRDSPGSMCPPDLGAVQMGGKTYRQMW